MGPTPDYGFRRHRSRNPTRYSPIQRRHPDRGRRGWRRVAYEQRRGILASVHGAAADAHDRRGRHRPVEPVDHVRGIRRGRRRLEPCWAGVGIYRSNNGGSTWTLMTRVPSTRFSAIVVHPRYPDVIYVAGNRGLHKSVERGSHVANKPRAQFAVRRSDHGRRHRLRAARHPRQPGARRGQRLTSGQLADFPTKFPPPPFNAERVYIGVHNDGVYRSTDRRRAVPGTPAFTRLDGPDQLPSGSEAGWIEARDRPLGELIDRPSSPRSSARTARASSPPPTAERRGRKKPQTWPSVGYDEWCSVIAVDPTDEDVMYAGRRGDARGGRPTAVRARATGRRSTPASMPDQQDIVVRSARLAADLPRERRRRLPLDDRGTNWTLASGGLAITQFYDIDVSEQDRDVVVGGAQDNGIYYRNICGRVEEHPLGRRHAGRHRSHGSADLLLLSAERAAQLADGAPSTAERATSSSVKTD